jgi:hypothetical protein
MKTKLLKLADEMYQVNRQISFKYIAMANKRTSPEKDYAISSLNRLIGNWIKELRTLAEEDK